MFYFLCWIIIFNIGSYTFFEYLVTKTQFRYYISRNQYISLLIMIHSFNKSDIRFGLGSLGPLHSIQEPYRKGKPTLKIVQE